jgi:hypothetical protein
MRRLVVPLACLVFGLGACSSGKSHSAATTTTTTAPSVSTTSSAAPTTSSTELASTSTVLTTTTRPACPATGSTGSRSTPARQPAALLTHVAVSTAPCTDSVVFTFRPHGTAVPSCTVEYRNGPFTMEASGAPVPVAGTAFALVRCEPAYGYDFETGQSTYTGPKRLVVPVPSGHVLEVVETGDSEGVVTWVVGLDKQRAFTVAATGSPLRQLIVTFS